MRSPAKGGAGGLPGVGQQSHSKVMKNCYCKHEKGRRRSTPIGIWRKMTEKTSILGKTFLSYEVTEEQANRNPKDHIFLDVIPLPDFFTKIASQPVSTGAILDFVLASNKDIKKSW